MRVAHEAARRNDEFGREPDANSSGSRPLVGGGMSFQATGWVLEFSESQLGARLVLLAISYRINNDTGICFPSLDTIAHECRMTKPGVIQAMERLESSGELTVDRTEGGSGNVNRYSMPKFLAWWVEAKKLGEKGKNSKRYFENGKADTPETVNANEERVNRVYQNSQEQKEEEPKENKPLSLEPGRPQPKPVREPKQRRGFEKPSQRPAASTRIVTNKQPESWIWFSTIFKRLADVNAVTFSGLQSMVDEMLAEIGREEAEERLSIYLDGLGKISGFAAKDFLEGGWRTVDPEEHHLPRIVNEGI